MAQGFARGRVSRRDGAADLADDLHGCRILSAFLGPFSHFFGEPGHLRAESGQVNRDRIRSWFECHFESMRSKIFAVEVEFLTAHRSANDLKVFLGPSQWMVHGEPVPTGDGRVGDADTEE